MIETCQFLPYVHGHRELEGGGHGVCLVVLLVGTGACLLEGTMSLFCQSGVFDVFMYINPRPKPATMRRIRLMV